MARVVQQSWRQGATYVLFYTSSSQLGCGWINVQKPLICRVCLNSTNNLQVHIVYLGEKQQDDPKLITDSHHDMLATVVGRYGTNLWRNKQSFMYLNLDWLIFLINLRKMFIFFWLLVLFSLWSKEMASGLMIYSYKHGFSGFAAKLTESQAQKLAGTSPINSYEKVDDYI